MIAALMCGGKGTRMHDSSGIEKPLQRVRGITMIDRVLHALTGSQMFEKIVAITSPNTPRTNTFLHLLSKSCIEPLEVIETKGHGFSQDLSAVLSSFKPARVFIVPVDLPMLKAKTVQGIIARCPILRPCVSILLEKAFVDMLGITASVLIPSANKLYCHSGISVIDCSKFERGSNLIEHYIVMNVIELAFNVNTKRELELAEGILSGGSNQEFLEPFHR